MTAGNLLRLRRSEPQNSPFAPSKFRRCPAARDGLKLRFFNIHGDFGARMIWVFTQFCTVFLTLAHAKPSGACEAVLRLTQDAIVEQKLVPLRAFDTLFVFAFSPKPARSRKAALVREWLERKNQTTATFSRAETRRGDESKVVRHVDELRDDDRKVKRFVEAKVAIIDSLEEFVIDITVQRTAENLALLREVVSERMRNHRPTLVTVDDANTIELYLSDLPEAARTSATADKK